MAAYFIPESSAVTDQTQSPLFSDTLDLSTSSTSEKDQLIQVHQWISTIRHIDSSNTNINSYLNSILGKPLYFITFIFILMNRYYIVQI